MSDLTSRLASLSAGQRQALERALAARRRTQDAAISPLPPGTPAPLSSGQRRLWFLGQLAPGVSTYHRLAGMWAYGALDVDVLEDAVRAVVARHEVIRTSIVLDQDEIGEPIQRPLTSWDFRLRRCRATAATSTGRRAEALAMATAMGREPYDLARDLILRAMVAQVEDNAWLIAFGEHHIAFDGWSDEIIYREISGHYNAAVAGRPVPVLRNLPVQFADFAAWEQARIASGTLAPQALFWTTTLAGAPLILDLPLDHPRPERQTFTGRHLPVDFDHGGGISALRSLLGATDFMILVAAWAATVYRWSGADDLVLGTPMANRLRPELEPLVGFFSNTVPLRIRIDGSQTFTQLVRDTTAVVLAAIDHQDLPFDRIVEALAPPRDPRANPLSQVNVRVQSGRLPRLELDGARVELIHMDIGFARFDMSVEMQMTGERIAGYLEYNDALFDEATAISVRDRLDMLIGAVVADPNIAIWDIPQPPSTAPVRRRRRSASP